MKKIFFSLIILYGVIFAQNNNVIPQRISHNSVQKKFTSDTLKILAVLVQFQTDTDSRTSGDGKFDLSIPSQKYVDAPPRDSAYFADHFVFAKNYFQKASNKKLHIKADVLGKVFTLNKQMKEYAPVNSNLPMAQMIEEAWKKADSAYVGFPFQNYDLFVLFHAGVGKDVDLRSTLGYDPTPLDIPSLYFNLDALKKLFGASYSGVLLPNANFKIPNTVVLPETENRKLPAVGGEFLLKLSINGVLVASIGSHLGLPDLFDTKTGKSAIGRFGLMDGQGMFSYSGICPPEPSAWEKTYLGWTAPITVSANQTITARAVSLDTVGNDEVYKIPISAKEYFLIENRNRDAKGNGQTVTMKWNGQIITKTFFNDENTFNNINIDSVYGVILDVDELDWSLPGYKSNSESYQGGILIWHIDETVIEKNLATNSVNANSNLRGVDLEEADGSQDIGQSYEFGSPGSGSEDGTLFDYWYKGNTAPAFANEFSATTYPNSLSNSLAKTNITIKNFSAINPIATFDVVLGNANLSLKKIFRRNNNRNNENDGAIAFDIDRKIDGLAEYIFTSGDSIYAFNADFTPLLNNNSGIFSSFGGEFQPSTLTYVLLKNIQGNFLVGSKDSTIYIFSGKDSDNNGLSDTVFAIQLNSKVTSPSLTLSISDSCRIYVGLANGKIANIFIANNTVAITYISVGSNQPITQLALPGYWYAQSGSAIYSYDGKIFSFSTSVKNFSIFFFRDQQFTLHTAIVGITENEIKIFDLTANQQFIISDKGFTGSLAIADIDGDNNPDIIVGRGNTLSVYSYMGVMVEQFPFKTLDGGSVIGSPIVVQDYQTKLPVIIFGSTNGHLYAVNSKGKCLNGFPLQTGGVYSSPTFNGNSLTVSSSDSSSYAWHTTELFRNGNSPLWSGFLSGREHLNVAIPVIRNPTAKSTELLPKKFAYNWPNPVYDNVTNIRYYLGNSAAVTIKIFNIAGELVDELKGSGNANLDNEVQWNVSKIQSGVYYAEIKAVGGGKEQSQIIKIAVVK